jgi:SAM-dependent methyltransferase
MTRTQAFRSYGAVGGPLEKLATYYRLVQGTRRSVAELPAYVGRVIEECRAVERMAEGAGLEVRGLQALEIGAGQLPRQMTYFARANDVTGIDLDRIAPEFDSRAYVEMLVRNGPGRVLKTIGRKALGFDRRLLKELHRQLGCSTPPKFKRAQMDATRMTFGDGSFDFVYSVDVFEHLPDPAAALAEVERVLRPGGVAAISLLPYTAEAGPHDLRTHGGPREGLAFWAHLRPQHSSEVRPSVYVNELTNAEWLALLAARLPGATLERSRAYNHEELATALRALRANGELADYDEQDLLGYRLRFCWRKPL